MGTRKPGWLFHQLQRAAEGVQTLPAWMRETSMVEIITQRTYSSYEGQQTTKPTMTTLEKANYFSSKLEDKIRSLKAKYEQLQKKINTLARMEEVLSGSEIKRITIVVAEKDDANKDAGIGLKPEEFPELCDQIKQLIALHKTNAEMNLSRFLEENND